MREFICHFTGYAGSVGTEDSGAPTSVDGLFGLFGLFGLPGLPYCCFILLKMLPEKLDRVKGARLELFHDKFILPWLH